MRTAKVQEPNAAIFQPITGEIVSQIKNDTVYLDSLFWINQNKRRHIQVVMTSKYIALCEKGTQNSIFHCYIELSFDLKFQIVYQGGVTSTNVPNAIFHQIIGFKLHKHGSLSLFFQICSLNLIDIWIKYLTRSLNQYGFHQMYRPVRKLGEGAFATVFQVERFTDKKHFAVKAFSKHNTVNSQNARERLTIKNEIAMMRRFDNPNIIKLEGVYESENSLYLILELLKQGQLKTRINQREGRFTTAEIRQFMIGIGKALKDMHQNRIMHRDIKPQNIMMRSGNSLDPVIGDFGLAENADSQDYIYYKCGTPGFVAPQIITLEKGNKTQPNCDIFSVGAIFHILLTKKPLFKGKLLQEIYENNQSMRFNLTSSNFMKVDPQAYDLLQKMLKIDPKKRISAQEMLEHPYLSGWQMQCEREDKDVISTIASKKRISQNIFLDV